MKRSATPLARGSRTKDGEASIPKHSVRSMSALPPILLHDRGACRGELQWLALMW